MGEEEVDVRAIGRSERGSVGKGKYGKERVQVGEESGWEKVSAEKGEYRDKGIGERGSMGRRDSWEKKEYEEGENRKG